MGPLVLFSSSFAAAQPESSPAAEEEKEESSSAPPPSAATPPASTPEPASPSVRVAGYVEAFYQHNFNRPSNLITAYRGFDNRASSFTIANAALDVTGQIGAVSTRLVLQIGHTPISYYAAEPTYAAQAGTGASGPELWRLIQQAIAGYKIPVGRGLLGEAGIFLSPIGLEGIAIKDQWNWSRSNLFYGLPFYHAGVRFTYPISDQLTGVVYATNGWNNVVNRNRYPCFAGVLSWTPSAAFSSNLLYFGGVEPFHDAPEGQPWRHLVDFTATWHALPSLSLAVQLDA
ncbi:MAG: outer membrane beta-barrel protein, partial [Kofleriaceae bacterium]